MIRSNEDGGKVTTLYAFTDNRNKTEWTYDCQGRKLTEKKGVSVSPELADRDDPDTTISWAYNKDSQVTRMTREDGTWVNYTYDDGGQVTQITITNTPTGYYGTTLQDFEYDGLGRLTESLDNNTSVLFQCTALRYIRFFPNVLRYLASAEGAKCHRWVWRPAVQAI